MKKLLYLLLIILFATLLVCLVCFKALDKTLYTQTAFYAKEMKAIDSVVASGTRVDINAPFEAGWARINLLPPFTTPIAIDAKRGGKHFEGVHDSIYVRAFVFRQGNYKVAYIAADLLIIPPSVTRLFDTLMQKQGFNSSNIFFTATHSHTSLGGWYNSYVGQLFAGKYDTRVPQFIATTIAAAIQSAEQNCSAAQIGYAEYPTRKLVFNRLITQMAHLPDSLGRVDSMLRVVKIVKATGQKAAIVTFAAHNTIFHQNLMSLSADWCGEMMKEVNQSGKADFTCFSAGAVGSHGPYPSLNHKEEEVTMPEQEADIKYMARGVAGIVINNFDSITVDSVNLLQMLHVPLYLREPNLRITENVVLRPWLFKKLFGDEPVFVNTLQLGRVFFAGMPCDFSGELVNQIDSVARRQNLKLVVTSFNGGYIGYITDSRRYRLNTYETRTMGWFGDKNGEYLSEIIHLFLTKTKPAENR